MLFVGILMRMQLQNYADVGLENSGAALLALSFLGALVALVGILACCCTTRQHPALLYLVSINTYMYLPPYLYVYVYLASSI